MPRSGKGGAGPGKVSASTSPGQGGLHGPGHGGASAQTFRGPGTGGATVIADQGPGRPTKVATVTNDVTNGGLHRITATAHGFDSGDVVVMAGVGGVTGGTGSFSIAVINANTFDLVGSTFGGSYTSGGTATRGSSI
jgi:hypothetical protein